MKIRFVTEGSINEYWESSPPCDCDVLFFGFNGLGEVDYRAELDGTTSKLEDLALLSRELGCVVVSGCLTDSCGIRHKSAAVAEGGKILGVADMLSAGEGEPYSCGAHLKVFETRAGKLGVCVGEDIYRPSLAEALALFDADVILSVFGGAEDSVPQLMMRACAFSAGLPVCMCADGLAQAAATDGDVLLRCIRKECLLDLRLTRTYRLTTRRTRGFSRRIREDF